MDLGSLQDMEAQIQFPTQFAQQGAPELLDPQGRLRQPGDLETDLIECWNDINKWSSTML
ncbi:hypothetical protein QTG54_001045 [Skeletonema marinoi]|uniref:Uncharacterized protein n=1 Tax=Skeletonema marinoi TaxID=267567 RepID=A0AAD8YM31_9STRA|nr:hypothetical protein QTG54_001045 [Skeletonema marinoi]